MYHERQVTSFDITQVLSLALFSDFDSDHPWAQDSSFTMSEIKFLVHYLDKDGNREIDAIELTNALNVSRVDERTDAQIETEVAMHREQGVSIFLSFLHSVFIASLRFIRILSPTVAAINPLTNTRYRLWRAPSRRNVRNASRTTTSVRIEYSKTNRGPLHYATPFRPFRSHFLSLTCSQRRSMT